MKNKLSSRINRAKDIYKKEGLVTLFRRIFTFLLSWFSYENCTFYVYVDTLENQNEADFIPKINNFNHRMVETTQQLDDLLNEGFDLSLLDITQARYRLEEGAIASLFFVGNKLAFRQWAAMTEEAKNTFNHYPYKVDFSHDEACEGDAWTNPEYRRQGIYTYADHKLEEFLMSKGIKKTRAIVTANNVASVTAQDKRDNHKICGKARYIRIGRMQSWKETPVD